MEIESDFTDDQRYNHYLHIANTLNYLENNGRVTEDWVEENKRAILQWREWISDFTDINPEIEEEEFRKRAIQTETLMQYLCRSIKSTGTFDVKVYRILLTNMKYLCDWYAEGDDFAEMINMMSM